MCGKINFSRERYVWSLYGTETRQQIFIFFIGSIILIYIHIFSFFRGSRSFQEEDFDSSAKTEYSVQSLCCAIKVQYIPFRDVSVETLHVVASYRGAQGNMRMFSLEIRTLEKVTSKAALRTLTSIHDGPEYEKA